MIDPDVVIVLAVAPLHTNTLGSLENIAAEKARLLTRLTGSRVAILNGDDRRVLALREQCPGRVVTFGCSPNHDFWAFQIQAIWPRRLTFRANTGTSCCDIRTNLIGDHWVHPVLAALAGAVAAGLSLEETAPLLAQVQPPVGRMQPLELPNGVTFLRDGYNESLTTMGAALRVLQTADTRRRVAIVGDVYDSPLKERPRLVDLGRRVAEAADLAVFIGEKMRYAASAAVESGMEMEARAFRDIPRAADFLASELRRGDLVLLRGASRRHLERLYFGQLGKFDCQLKWCSRNRSCDDCPQLGFEARKLDQSPLS